MKYNRFIARVFWTAALTFLTLQAQASIPNSRTIVSRLAKNSGRGVYVIDQEVRFSGPEGLVLRERWLVQNAEAMRLTVQGEKAGEFRYDALYKDGRRTSSTPALLFSSDPTKTEPGKDPRTLNVSGDFFEPYLYFRSSAKFLEYFVRAKILPPSSLSKDRARIANINTYKPTPEVAVRLGRTAGTVAWVFGEPTPVDGKTAYPGAWIEQDAFLLRKLRLPSQAEMSLADHAAAGGGLKLARERTIVWRSNDPSVIEPRAATIKVISVKNLPEKSLAPQFLPTSISASELKSARLPDAAVAREFYSRFR